MIYFTVLKILTVFGLLIGQAIVYFQCQNFDFRSFITGVLVCMFFNDIATILAKAISFIYCN